MADDSVGEVEEVLYAQFNLLEESDLSVTPFIDDQTVQHQIGHVTVHGATLAHVEETLSALGQLARLAQTNAAAWTAVVVRLWPDVQVDLMKMRRYLMDEGVDTFVIGLEIACDGRDAVRVCNWLGSAAFRDRHESTDSPALPIFLTPPLLDRNEFSNHVLAYIASHADPDRSTSLIKRVTIRTPITDEKRLQYVLSLARKGIALTTFPGLAIDVEDCNRWSLVDKIQQIFAVTNRRHTVPVAPIRFANLKTDISDTTRLTHCMVISAIGASSSVRQVSVDLRKLDQFDGRVRVAQLLAYALFSKDNTHTIRRFVLDRGTMSGSAIQAMQEMLRADDPLISLFPRYAQLIAANAKYRLSATELVLIEPDGFNTDGIWKLRANLCQLRILRILGDWYFVFVPAWGCARVHKKKAKVSAVTITTAHQIKDLKICAQSKEEMERSLSWLSLVGQRVSQVDIDGWRLWPDPLEVDLDQIRAAFPSMEKIRLINLKIDTLHRLITDIGDGVFEVKHLHLSNVSICDKSNDEFAVLKALATPSHRMASNMVSFCIAATRSNIDQAKLMEAALAMLAKNRVLQSFELEVKFRRAVNYEATVKAFAAQSGVEVPSQACLSLKLALMSVVLDRGLERDILKLIFRLAGFFVRRQVTLRIRKDL